MYKEFYGLSEKPFNLTPDPRFLYLSKKHKEAFAHLMYGIRHRSGFVMVSGEIGTGKTTICRSLLKQLDPDIEVALIFNPYLSPVELLQCINRDFGIKTESTSILELVSELNTYLLEKSAAGKNCVLIIDEAQDLSAEILEQIRLLSNLETEKEKLIQIMLIGQPELAQKLELHELRQLNQRITARYHLEALGEEETLQYVAFRLRVAGGRKRVRFNRKAIKKIYRISGGTPRVINALCDRSLLIGYTKEAREITPAIVALAAKEIQGNEHVRIRRLNVASILRMAGAVVLSAVVVLLIVLATSGPIRFGQGSGIGGQNSIASDGGAETSLNAGSSVDAVVSLPEIEESADISGESEVDMVMEDVAVHVHDAGHIDTPGRTDIVEVIPDNLAVGDVPVEDAADEELVVASIPEAVQEVPVDPMPEPIETVVADLTTTPKEEVVAETIPEPIKEAVVEPSPEPIIEVVIASVPDPIEIPVGDVVSDDSMDEVAPRVEEVVVASVPESLAEVPETSANVVRISDALELRALRRALEELLAAWDVDQIVEYPASVVGAGIVKFAESHGFSINRLDVSLGQLMVLNCPLLIEVDFGGGVYWLALLRVEGSDVFVTSASGEVESVSISVLESAYRNSAVALWRDPYVYQEPLRLTHQGEAVWELQHDLVDLGVLKQEPNGVYDAETADAIARVQGVCGFREDGVFGAQSRMVLASWLNENNGPHLSSKAFPAGVLDSMLARTVGRRGSLLSVRRGPSRESVTEPVGGVVPLVPSRNADVGSDQ